MEDEIKVGNLVECIELRGLHLDCSQLGYGFKSGLQFIVESIFKSSDDDVVYFGGVNGNGVYKPYVKKVHRGKFKLYRK